MNVPSAASHLHLHDSIPFTLDIPSVTPDLRLFTATAIAITPFPFETVNSNLRRSILCSTRLLYAGCDKSPSHRYMPHVLGTCGEASHGRQASEYERWRAVGVHRLGLCRVSSASCLLLSDHNHCEGQNVLKARSDDRFERSAAACLG